MTIIIILKCFIYSLVVSNVCEQLNSFQMHSFQLLIAYNLKFKNRLSFFLSPLHVTKTVFPNLLILFLFLAQAWWRLPA